jgi:putative chitinase
MTAARITAPRLKLFARRCDELVMASAMDRAAAEFEISTPRRLAHWLGQLHHESAGLTRLEEDLSYTAERLCVVWPKRFPTLAAAQPYARNPQALAEKVYGGRMGNAKIGDGWRYRGRGLMMNTGLEGYARIGLMIGEDLVRAPDRLRIPSVAARAAAAFWAAHDLNVLADRDDVVAVTEIINGGLNGLADRRAQVARAKAIWP